METAEAMLCWNRGTDEVKVVRWPDSTRESRGYRMTALACDSSFASSSYETRKTRIFIEAMHLIVRDKCDPMAVHRALLGLAEYRDGCSRDMPELPLDEAG